MVNLRQNLKRLFLNIPTLIRIVVFVDALPNLRISGILAEYLPHDTADDHASGGVEVGIEEENLIMRLFFDLLRQLA
jgi:hypothetical protein